MSGDNFDEIGRFPALVIGLGGTGVRVLRYMRYLAEREGDEGLKRMWQEGRLQMLAIDTDWRANEADQHIDRFVIAHAKAGRSQRGRRDRPLLPVVDDLILVQSEAITRAIEVVKSSYREQKHPPRVTAANPPDQKQIGKQAADKEEDIKHQTIAAWFPVHSDATGNQITLGQARYEGAGQWRALGRAGLFLKSREIYERLQRRFDSLQKGGRRRYPVRVYIVCSIAGGTGSGMFWDIALLLRTLDGPCVISGAFLLPEAFEGVDRADRIHANAYAAIKEISLLKNTRNEKEIVVQYPIGVNKVTVSIPPGSRSILDQAYVYGAFPPDGTPAEISDMPSTTIQMSCFRIAENIVAQLRTDVRSRIDEGANNERSDTNATKKEKIGSYVFSTSMATNVRLSAPDDITGIALWEYFGRTRRRMVGEERRYIRLEDAEEHLRKAYEAEKVRGNEGGQQASYPVRPKEKRALAASPLARGANAEGEDWLLGIWLRDIEDLPLERLVAFAEPMKKLNAMKDEAERVGQENKEKGKRLPEQVADIRRLYRDYIDAPLHEGWREATQNRPVGSRERPSYAIGNSSDLLQANVQAVWEPFEQALKALLNEFADLGYDGPPVLHQGLREKLEATKAYLRGIGQKATQADKRLEPFYLNPPQSVWRFRSVIKLLEPRTGEDARVHESIVRGSRGSARDRGIEMASDILEEYQRIEAAVIAGGRMTWRAACEDFLGKYSDSIVRIIDRILEESENNNNVLRRRSQQLGLFLEDFGIPDDESKTGREEKERRFESIMDPLSGILMRVLASEDGTKRVIKDLVETVRRVTKSNTRERGKEITFDNNELSKLFQAFLREVDKELSRGQEATGNSNEVVWKDPLLARMVDLLEREVLAPLDLKVWIYIGDEIRFQDFLIRIHSVIAGFFTFWLEQEQFVLERLGGHTGIAEMLRKCTSNVFSRGEVERKIHKEDLVIARPLSERSLPIGGGDGRRDRLEAAFGEAAMQLEALNVEPKYTMKATRDPIIYYEERYRAAQEIARLQDYHKKYIQIPPAQRANYHLFPGLHEEPNFYTESERPKQIFCGNEGCDENLIVTPVEAILCPGCQRPIRNRCGNPGCSSHHLADEIARVTGGGERKPPYLCPSCNKDLKTYWWFCKDVEHSQAPIETVETSCPQCLDEYRKGKRAEHQIGRLEVDGEIECPGCLKLDVPREERGRVPAELVDFFYGGVARAMLPTFLKKVAEKGLHPHLCPNKSRVHFLFPTYPDYGHQEEDWKHVHTASGWLTMVDDLRLKFFTCYHCNYPIGMDEERQHQLEDGGLVCPRCLRSLTWCFYCSNSDGKLFQPERTDTTPNRCPRCTNLMEPPDGPGGSGLGTSGLTAPGFCPNLFGCRAGANPWHTAAEYGYRKCHACKNRDKPALLLRYDSLGEHIRNCPMCLTLIGLPSSTGVARMAPDALARHVVVDNPIDRGSKACAICGAVPAAVLHWMAETGYFTRPGFDPAETEHIEAIRSRYQGDHLVPVVDADLLIEFLQALIDRTERPQVYAVAKRIMATNGRGPLTLSDSVVRLYPSASIMREHLLGDVETYIKEYEQEVARIRLIHRREPQKVW